MDPSLRLHPGQTRLTPEQEAEVERFTEAYIRRLLSTEAVDEAAATALLRQAYEVAGLAAPRRIHWMDGPLQLMAAPASDHLKTTVWDSFMASRMKIMCSIWASVGTFVGSLVTEPLIERVRVSVWASVGLSITQAIWHNLRKSSADDAQIRSIQRSISAPYVHASWLAWTRFFDTYFVPNEAHAWAHFNELVSGYWLGQEEAVIVRRPCVLSRDAAGRLHSVSGSCIEYHDGWGFYAWHGVRVSERVILAPEVLTRDDFLGERNLEVRRVIQERMGSRFVSELGGVVLDSSRRGTLYEVALPGDPERVARYVQVQDASTERQYPLRVPPTVQTAAEAVAWSFQMTVEEYAPAHET